MHTTIWSWIQRYISHTTGTWNQLIGRPGPMDILSELIRMIDDELIHEISHRHVVHRNEAWSAELRNMRLNLLGDFSEVVCNKAQQLYEHDNNFRMTWLTLKHILHFYLNDSINYINNINSLTMTAVQQNEFFELGVNFDQERDTMTVDKFRNILLFSRYLTGVKIYNWSENLQRYEIYCLARGEEYWCEKILQTILAHHLPPSPPPTHSRPIAIQAINPTKKKLTELLAFIEEKQGEWLMKDGDYLKLTEIMKDAFDSI